MRLVHGASDREKRSLWSKTSPITAGIQRLAHRQTHLLGTCGEAATERGESVARRDSASGEAGRGDRPAGKLKHPSGWFAAGREVSRALGLLSDGAFRLYIYLCLNADRRTGQMSDYPRRPGKGSGPQSPVDHYISGRTPAAASMPRSERHQSARSGHIEICDAFWPYEKTRKETATQDRASYVAQIQRLMGSRRCVASSFAPADEKLANALFQRGVPIQQVERGFLLGCTRKYVTLLNGNSRELIVSFSYFQNVIEEAGELQMSEDYWRYLQLRIHQMERQWLEQTQASGEGKFNKRLTAPISGRI